MTIGTVNRGDLVCVGPKAPGLWIVDSVNGDDLGIVELSRAAVAKAGADSGEPIQHVSASTDVFAVYSSSSIAG